MLSVHNIATIAKFEWKILFRSWFFRIFAILSIVIIGIFSAIFLFDRGPYNWAFRSLPSALSYSNFFLLNIFQSVIAVFLATDFLKRDKKLDTSEVLFIRPMSNFEYVTGKTLGLLTVFVALNLLVMILTSIFVFASGQIPFRLTPLVAYFFLISIPTLVFVVGLAYTFMSILKNQAITFILLLGYIALVIFYLAEKPGYLFDYMVFKMPVAYSDIIGFSDSKSLLIHRFSYFMMGVGLILFTTWRLKRKANKASSLWVLSALSALTLLIAFTGFVKLYSDRKTIETNRKENVALCGAYFDKPVPLMRKASIVFEQGSDIKARSEMTLRNKTAQVIDTLFFSLNPGLKVSKAMAGSVELSFIQEKMLVKVVPTSPMRPGDDLIVTLEYSGLPDFNISYLDIDNEKVYGFESQGTIAVDKKYGFYTNEYVLLTKENLWYPIPGIAYDPLRPAIFRQQFTRFDLIVKTLPGMVAVSQGEREKTDSLGYHFIIRDPLPQLSLNIGKFEEKSIKVGEINVSLAHIKGHDYYADYFTELKDTAKVLIADFLDDFERPLGMYYPYKQFSVVEVPVQFSSQPHTWTSTLAESQPQMVFLPEWGFDVSQADFKNNGRRIQRESERNKEGLEPKEIQSRVFTNFLKGVFTATQEQSGFGPPTTTVESNPFSIFPNYFYYVNYITSPECPVLNYAFESYFQKGEDDPRQLFFSGMNGIGDDEKANIKLKSKSLKEIISGDEEPATVSRVLKAKGSYLLSWMEKQTQSSDFRKFMLDYLYTNSYKEIKYEELASDLSAQLNIGMGNFISEWYNTKGLPAFTIGDVKAFETIGESQVVYLIRTTVTNRSNVPGLIKLSFMLGDGGRGRGGFGFGGFNQTAPEVRSYLLKGNETKEIQVLLNESPRSLIFNTLIAENIPSKKMIFNIPVDKDQRIKAEEYEKVIDQPVELSSPGDLVVDNTDSTFTTFDPTENNPIRKLFAKKSTNEEDKFVGQGFGPPPSTWSLSANTDYYGITEQSAYVVRSGDGSKTATWKKVLPEAGYYDVFVYLTEQRRFRGFGGPGGPGRGNNEPEGKFVYTVSHDDGDEEIELEIKDVESGWNLLGSFYISSDTATVRLSDKGGADRVVADAVKWVQQRQ